MNCEPLIACSVLSWTIACGHPAHRAKDSEPPGGNEGRRRAKLVSWDDLLLWLLGQADGSSVRCLRVTAMSVNKTAKTLGLTFPITLLGCADEVIE
jgi:hypothetical protein